MNQTLKNILAGVILLLGAGHGTVQAEVVLLDGWIQEAPPGSRVLAGYLVLENTGPVDRQLVNASSPLFERVEMHRSVIVDDVARMESQSALTVPAGSMLEMRPGDYHLMLFDPDTRLQAGMEVELLLVMDDDSQQRYSIEVKRAGRKHHEHDHHGHDQH